MIRAWTLRRVYRYLAETDTTEPTSTFEMSASFDGGDMIHTLEREPTLDLLENWFLLGPDDVATARTATEDLLRANGRLR